MSPGNIAVSAALLFNDFLHQRKLHLNIKGETNNSILIYKTLSDFLKYKNDIDNLDHKILWDRGFSEELCKFLTTRYSISVFGISEDYPSQIGAVHHANIKRQKFQLQREAYELVKDMSINDAAQRIAQLHNIVKEYIHDAGHNIAYEL